MSTWYCFGYNQKLFIDSGKKYSARYRHFDKFMDTQLLLLTQFSLHFSVSCVSGRLATSWAQSLGKQTQDV